MNVSAKTEYACLAALELAMRHGERGPVRIRDIADKHGIPSRFLVQILLQLKSAGIVHSMRGAAGGYRLSSPPTEMTLGQVVAAAEGPQAMDDADPGSPALLVLRQAWRDARAAHDRLLHDLTLADLAARVQGPASAMYYI